MSLAPPHRGARRGMSASLWAAVLCALGQLPAERFPPAWILAFCLPALILLWSAALPMGFWPRLSMAAGLQIGAAYGALHFSGELERAAALACTLLPPLSYVAARRQEADVLLGLFLAFCMLLVGVMLRGGADLALLAGFVAFASLTLRLETRWSTLLEGVIRVEDRPERPRLRLRSLAVVAACGLATLGFTRALSMLPVPGEERDRAVAGRPAASSIGLSDRFDLDAAAGTPLDLRSNRLVRVRTLDRGGVPEDLYLRSAFFDLPGLDGWGVGRFEHSLRDTTHQDLRLRRPVPAVPVRGLDIERLVTTRGLVFAPPGTHVITGLPDLEVEPARVWLRQRDLEATQRYGIEYQDLRAVPGASAADRRWVRGGLTWLPSDLDLSLFAGLIQEWGLRPGGPPLRTAEAIAQRIQQRCVYALQEPEGSYPHSLLNFLDGSREGYCMHFASATAILLRMLEVPCRIGVGLYGGEPDPEEAGARVYGSQHAHAWVEIPFAGLGWVVFDPTPPSARAAGALVPGAVDRVAAGDGEDPEAVAGIDLHSWMARVVEVIAQPLFWAAVLLSWGLFGFRPGRRRPPAEPPVAHRVRSVRRHLVQVLRALARRGSPRSRGQTLEQYLDGLAGVEDLDVEVLAAAFRAYQEVRFGHRPYDPGRQGCLARALREVRADQRISKV